MFSSSICCLQPYDLVHILKTLVFLEDLHIPGKFFPFSFILAIGLFLLSLSLPLYILELLLPHLLLLQPFLTVLRHVR